MVLKMYRIIRNNWILCNFVCLFIKLKGTVTGHFFGTDILNSRLNEMNFRNNLKKKSKKNLWNFWKKILLKFFQNLPTTTLPFLEHGALELSYRGDAGRKLLAMCLQCAQSIVQTFLVDGEDNVKNLPIFGEREFRSGPLLEQLLKPPGEDGGLWMRNNGDLGGVGETELLECLLTLSPNWRSGGVNLFSIFKISKISKFFNFSIFFFS